MSLELIIWDFDGVIADTEQIWLANRLCLLQKEYGLNWSKEKISQKLYGLSDQSKRDNLLQEGLKTDDDFWKKVLDLDFETFQKAALPPTSGVEEIFKMPNLKQCIATGGTAEKTKWKIQLTGIEKYFSFEKNNVFTVDMVRYGKPEPDLFLLALVQMGVQNEKALVVEDSPSGLMAAIRSGCLPVAFIPESLRGDQVHLNQIKRLGIEHIFDDMAALKSFIESRI